jgi:hypothetical protein
MSKKGKKIQWLRHFRSLKDPSKPDESGTLITGLLEFLLYTVRFLANRSRFVGLSIGEDLDGASSVLLHFNIGGMQP